MYFNGFQDPMQRKSSLKVSSNFGFTFLWYAQLNTTSVYNLGSMDFQVMLGYEPSCYVKTKNV